MPVSAWLQLVRTPFRRSRQCWYWAKDLDARWAKKNQQVFYGYKNHVNVDLESKLIIRCEVTDAAVHDSQALDAVTRKGDPEAWLDSGYSGHNSSRIYPTAVVLLAISGPEQEG